MFLTLLIALTTPANADVVKPALTEIKAYKSGKVELEIRVSIEALLTGINSQYRRTQDAPQADAYDAIRPLPPEELKRAFDAFVPRFIEHIELRSQNKEIPLAFVSADIPPAGYTQVPRISTLYLRGTLPTNASTLRFYYPAAFGDQAVRVRQIDEQAEQWHWSEWEWIRDGRPSQDFSLTEIVARRSTWEVVKEFVEIGFLHIVPKGQDHILFILGIFFFSHRWRPLLWQVTMFTLAHTITLGLSSAGLISLPARVVEPLIALSIAWIGVENIWANAHTNKRISIARLALVFAFGLLHGLGFASVLTDFGLAPNAFFTSLLSFNLGVEAGQIAVLAAAWLLTIWLHKRPYYQRYVAIPISLLIAVMGLIWFFERLSG